jgi:ABC-2 type transport system ATP-binding protein
VSEFAIRTYELTKVYGDTPSVDRLNLEVAKGSFTAIVGPNGAGKTTTIKMLLGLVHPTSGRAEVLGKDPLKEGHRVRSQVGFVPETQSLYGYMTARELLGFTSRLYERWDSALVAEYVDRFELPLNKKIRDFSQGMKVQLSLIAALAPHPELLILDEPFNGLDPTATRHFLRAVVDEVGRRGQSVLMATHLLFQIERVAETVNIIDRGKLVLSRPMDEIKLNEKKIRVAFQLDPPDYVFSLPGVAGVEREGRRCVFRVTDNLEEVMSELSKIPHFALEVVDLNLEDVFIDYTRGKDGKTSAGEPGGRSGPAGPTGPTESNESAPPTRHNGPARRSGTNGPSESNGPTGSDGQNEPTGPNGGEDSRDGAGK